MKMPTIVGIFIFISRENFMLSWVEHEKRLVTLMPGLYWTVNLNHLSSNLWNCTFWHVRTRAVWPVFVVSTKKLCILSYPNNAHWRFWTDNANAHVDLNLRWAHMSEHTCTFLTLRVIHVHFWHCGSYMYIFDIAGHTCTFLTLLVIHVHFWHCGSFTQVSDVTSSCLDY